MAILTISREFGSGGREIGHAVADVMRYDYVDRGKILDDMRQAGKMWEEKAKHFDENYPELWERNDWTYRGFVSLNQSHFLEHAVKGNAVIMGRGGNFLLEAFPMVLKVRTTAPIESRIERVMVREGINNETARYLIEKADSEMAKAVYLIYGKHWDDPGEYDFVFDTSKQGEKEIVAVIKDALLAKDRFDTDDARNALRLRALAEKIKAAILTDPTFVISMLDVDPREEGLSKFGLVLRGIVHELEDIKGIEKLSREMAGDIPVESHLQYRMYPRLGRR
jgi:cytidylate kinase